MFRLFGGKRLLRWKEPRHYQEAGRLAHLPFMMKIVVTLGAGALLYIIYFVVGVFAELFLEHGSQVFSWKVFIFVLQKSLIWGSIIGSTFMFLSLLPRLIVPKIIIREYWVERRLWLRRHKWRFSELRFYDFALSTEEVDGRYLHFLLLADRDDDKMISFEIPISIDESELVEAFRDRLPPANVYFDNLEN